MTAADDMAQVVHSMLGVTAADGPAGAEPARRLPAPNLAQGRATGAPPMDPMAAATAAFSAVTLAVIHGPKGMWTDIETLERS